MMGKIIILGARGMLGSDLRKVFADASPYVLDKDELDITNRNAVFQVFENIKPEIVINAAAYTDVDGCETNRELAMDVNGKAPGYLGEASKKIGAVLVHYSTDYIFHGDKAKGYSEDDEPGSPLNFYGETKLAGENSVKNFGCNYYIIRTSWLFGLNGKNFVETILRKAGEFGGQTPKGGSDPPVIRVVNDQNGKPTFALDLAKKTREILSGNYDFGIYHAVNEPATTWYDFACEILRKSIDTHASIRACTSAEFPRPSKRPHYSILLNTKLSPMRPWQEALAEYLRTRSAII